jgi:hypothetical protein
MQIRWKKKEFQKIVASGSSVGADAESAAAQHGGHRSGKAKAQRRISRDS